MATIEDRGGRTEIQNCTQGYEDFWVRVYQNRGSRDGEKKEQS